MYFEEINEKFSKTRATEEKVDFLSNLRHFDLANFVAQSSQNVRDALLSQDYDKLWYNRFNKLRVGREKDFQFRDPSPQTQAEFYCGYVFYVSALAKKSSDEDIYNDYLWTAIARLSSFHAINERVQMLLNSCDTTDNADQVARLLEFLTAYESQIHEFQTPGFLLLANTYLTLSSLYAEMSYTQQKTTYLEKGWKNLHLAELLYDESEKSIHNAYLGEGIRLSNRYGLSNIADIKEHILKYTPNILNAEIRDDIEQSASYLLIQPEKTKTELEIPQPGINEKNKAGPITHICVSYKPEVKEKTTEEIYNDFITPDELGTYNRTTRNDKLYGSACRSVFTSSSVFFKNKKMKSIETREAGCHYSDSNPM